MKYDERQVEYLKNNIDNLVIEWDGAGKWKSSGNYIPQDCAEIYANVLGVRIDVELTKFKRDRQQKEHIAEYRKNWRPPSGEMLAEMRSAFGEGVEVVDVLAGRRFRI